MGAKTITEKQGVAVLLIRPAPKRYIPSLIEARRRSEEVTIRESRCE